MRTYHWSSSLAPDSCCKTRTLVKKRIVKSSLICLFCFRPASIEAILESSMRLPGSNSPLIVSEGPDIRTALQRSFSFGRRWPSFCEHLQPKNRETPWLRSGICCVSRVVNRLNLLILGLQRPLHVEIQLSILHLLLPLHIPQNTGVHSLENVSMSTSKSNWVTYSAFGFLPVVN